MLVKIPTTIVGGVPCTTRIRLRGCQHWIRLLSNRKETLQVSVFALAPQHLLIELGTLLGDILPVSLHQKYREQSTWKWQLHQPAISFNVRH